MDGLLLIDKPAGWTSHDAVNFIRRSIKEKRVGHTGTLDPDATGLLLVLVGKATRLARYHDDDEKEYVCVMTLGTETDTQDASGSVIEELPVPELGREDVEAIFGRFKGEISQTPPMYSAVKVGGQPLYKLARKGEEIERQARTVVIRELEIISAEPPEITFRVVCSKGTYIRTLCSEIGRAMGTRAHMKTLRRTTAGGYPVAGALDISDKPAGEIISGRVIPVSEMLGHLPEVTVDDEAAAGVKDGRRPAAHSITATAGHPAEGSPVRVTDASGRLLAVGEYGGPAGEVSLSVVLV